MTNHHSQTPEPAASYFAQFDVTEHPIIAQTYHPERGWRNFPIRKRVSGSEIRKLRRAGHTWVRLDAGTHQADFQLCEMSTEHVGLDLVSRYPVRTCSICGGETEHDADAHAEEGQW